VIARVAKIPRDETARHGMTVFFCVRGGENDRRKGRKTTGKGRENDRREEANQRKLIKGSRKGCKSLTEGRKGKSTALVWTMRAVLFFCCCWR